MTSLRRYFQLLFWVMLWAYSCSFFACANGNDYPLANQYINKYKKIAVTEMHRIGIPASIKLAQGILESDYGRSRLALDGKNHFGIKCKSYWKGDTIRITDDAPMECFRKYPSVRHSYVDHSNFLKYHPYHYYDQLFKLKRRDYKGWAYGLKKAGYATNPKYTSIIINLVEKYDLHRFDEMLPEQVNDQPQILAQKTRIERQSSIPKFAPVDPYKAHYDKQKRQQQANQQVTQNDFWKKQWNNWEQQKQQKLVLKSQPNSSYPTNTNTVRNKYIPPRDRLQNNPQIAQNTSVSINRNKPQYSSPSPKPRPTTSTNSSRNLRPTPKPRPRPTTRPNPQPTVIQSAPKPPPARFDPNIPIVTMDQLKARGQAKSANPQKSPKTNTYRPKPQNQPSKSLMNRRSIKSRPSRDYRIAPQATDQAQLSPNQPPPPIPTPDYPIFEQRPDMPLFPEQDIESPINPPPAPADFVQNLPQEEEQVPDFVEQQSENFMATNEIQAPIAAQNQEVQHQEMQDQPTIAPPDQQETSSFIPQNNVAYEPSLGIEKTPLKMSETALLASTPPASTPLIVQPISINKCKAIISNKELSPAYIARAYGLSIKNIYEFNEISSKENFGANTYIFLESKKNRAIKGLDIHVVEETESMKSIAQLYGIKLKSLYKKNKMKQGQEPAPKQRLYLRKKAPRRPILIFDKV